ncbi:gluconeogenesis factor YvcK family protein [Longirhabdus pacifica]|uniref:gluconeogenesis factor YvcK family protein n=1 Tax=Longirhabdus pacifica TaxID=2305227 RepID=UPI001008B7D8|nr:YvcK family protein [Longirhabdus pacifica]
MTQTGEQRNIVVIGGGTGLSVMLRGLKQHNFDISAIVTVADDGGSSGRLRSEMKIPPPGDIRNVISALADVEPMMSQLLQYRFKNGNGLSGHSLGNLILAAMNDITGDFVTGIKQLSRVFAVKGRVLPAANQAMVLKAEMVDGTIVEGESNIPKAGKKIKRVFIEPADLEPLQEALDVLHEADGIVIGPGSLYTSILPNLMVPKIASAVKNSKAKKIFVCNVMTQPGETDNYTVSHHVNAVHEHIGSSLFDYVIVNEGNVSSDILHQYEAKGSSVVQVDEDAVRSTTYKVISDRLINVQTYLRHDAEKLSEHIAQLLL